MRWILAMALTACAARAQVGAVPVTTTSATVETNHDSSAVVPESDGDAKGIDEVPTPVWTTKPTLDDAQVAAMLDTANSAATEQAAVALRRASDTRVIDFAQLMATDDRQAMTAEHMMLSSRGILPEPSDASNKMSADASRALTELLSEPVRLSFDRAYVNLQARELGQLIDAIDNTWIPAVGSADLKSALLDLRAKAADHLQRARDLQQTLAQPQ
jgi:predicted outer membrane protein